jgi:hypothetical protein
MSITLSGAWAPNTSQLTVRIDYGAPHKHMVGLQGLYEGLGCGMVSEHGEEVAVPAQRGFWLSEAESRRLSQELERAQWRKDYDLVLRFRTLLVVGEAKPQSRRREMGSGLVR